MRLYEVFCCVDLIVWLGPTPVGPRLDPGWPVAGPVAVDTFCLTSGVNSGIEFCMIKCNYMLYND